MRARLALFCLSLLLLSGCAGLKSRDWSHPRMASQRKEDQLLLEDTKFCEDKIGPQLQGAEREKALADCLRRLGWQHRDD